MSSTHKRRRVLIAATNQERCRFRSLFRTESLSSWESAEADSFECARFLMQMDPCDVLLLDGSLYPLGGTNGLAWLAGQHQMPVVFLGSSSTRCNTGRSTGCRDKWHSHNRNYLTPCCNSRPVTAIFSGDCDARPRLSTTASAK